MDTPSDEPDSAAAEAANGVGNKWWNPLGIGRSGVGCGTSCGTGCCGRGCGVGTSNLWYNPCGGLWYASFGALGMTRNAPNPFWTTADSVNVSQQLMNTKQAGYGAWGPGGQMTLARWWCPCNTGCGCGPQYMLGLQFVYWQLADMNNGVAVNTSRQYVSAIDFSVGSIPNLNGQQPGYYFDGSQSQKILRTDRYLNIEINGLVQPIYNNPGCFSATLLAGFRYFRFQDVVTYGSVRDTYYFGQDGGIYDAYIQSNCTNNLFGGQIGTLLNFAVTPTWGLYAIPKFGVFGNQINIANSYYGGNGAVAYDIHASGTVCSLMGELDSGAYWWMTPNCQLYAGWRVVGLSNVALADNQFLPYLADSAGFATVKSNGDVILTGAFAGFSVLF